MKYQKIQPISRGEAEAIILEGRVKEIPLTLISLSYFEPEWRWVQDLCIGLSTHEDEWVKTACLAGFGHIARIHGVIDRDKVDPVLNRLSNDPDVAGSVKSTLDDSGVFLKR